MNMCSLVPSTAVTLDSTAGSGKKWRSLGIVLHEESKASEKGLQQNDGAKREGRSFAFKKDRRQKAEGGEGTNDRVILTSIRTRLNLPHALRSSD